MNYEEAVALIQSRVRFGEKIGLENIRVLLERLGNPQNDLKFLHVAGTNGKGSTSAYLTSVLIKSGYRTGMYISPYVHSFTERIQVNREEISPAELARLTAVAAAAIDEDHSPSEFELITAMGMLYFKEQECDYVVLEVGLGGRFDATNIIPAPEVAVITSLGIDHTQQLGDTLPQIAFEKSGIIKPGTKVAVYPDNAPEALDMIQSAAQKAGVPVLVGEKEQIEIHKSDITGTDFSYKGRAYHISLLGEHQVYNAVTAITALSLLDQAALDIRGGLAETRFRGRFEVVRKRPLTIVDGAHNYSGVVALKEGIRRYFPGNKIILVMGMLQDKEYEKCVREIAPCAGVFIATQPDNPRALPAERLAALAKEQGAAAVALPDRVRAVRHAASVAGPEDVILICGSLYLIGDLERYIEERPE